MFMYYILNIFILFTYVYIPFFSLKLVIAMYTWDEASRDMKSGSYGQHFGLMGFTCSKPMDFYMIYPLVTFT